MASIYYVYLNNIAASLISNPERCGNPISHLHKALLNLSQTPHTSSQAILERRGQAETIAGDDLSSNIQTGTETSTNNPLFDEGMDIFAQPLFLQSSCNHSKQSAEPTILFNLGLAYCSIQDYKEGILYLEKSIAVTQKVPSMISPSEAPSQHVILCNIGRVHFLSGNYSEAIRAYSRTLVLTEQEEVAQDLKPEEESTFSEIDPFHTAAALNCIAVCRLHSHDAIDTYPLDKTLLLLHRALCILDKVLLSSAYKNNKNRSVTLETAVVMNNIGRAQYQLEDYSGALSMYTKSCILRKDLLGNDHLDVAVSFYNMAEAQCCLGNKTEAITGYETFISIATEKLGSHHPAVTSGLTAIGQLYYKVNDCYLALKYLSLALKSSLKDEEVAAIHNLIGSALVEVGEADAALVAFKKGLHIERKIGVSEDEVVKTLFNIGYALSLQKKFDEALGYYQEAREGIERTKGACDELVSIKTKIALVHERQERYFDAEQELKAVLELNNSLHGSLSLQASSTWNFLGLLYHDWGSNKQSLECFSKCLRIKLQSPLEPRTSVLLSLYNNIATTHYVLDEMDQALHFYNEMHCLEEEELSTLSQADDNISDIAKSVLSTLQNIARVYQKKGKLDTAHQYLTKASTFFHEHEEMMCDSDRHSLYLSFEMYQSNFRMRQASASNSSARAA
jgi:tetratricopeptide (TPR) repeat protein